MDNHIKDSISVFPKAVVTKCWILHKYVVVILDTGVVNNEDKKYFHNEHSMEIFLI